MTRQSRRQWGIGLIVSGVACEVIGLLLYQNAQSGADKVNAVYNSLGATLAESSPNFTPAYVAFALGGVLVLCGIMFLPGRARS